MQGRTRGGQCDWRNVTGGRRVRADGVRLGPAGQGTADVSDGVGGQSHPHRADSWSRAGGPRRPWRVVAWVLAGDSEQGAWPTHPRQDPGLWPGGLHPADVGGWSVVKGTAGSLLEGDSLQVVGG